MAMDVFLKLSNDVTGESKVSGHEDEIDVLAWSWSMNQSGSMHVGGGGGSGKVSVNDVSITKYMDKASSVILKKCCNGTHFDNATLVIRKAGGDSPVDYYKLTMEKVMITSISTGGSGGEDQLTENITLNFANFTSSYTPQQDDGSADAAIDAGWDIEANVEK